MCINSFKLERNIGLAACSMLRNWIFLPFNNLMPLCPIHCDCYFADNNYYWFISRHGKSIFHWMYHNLKSESLDVEPSSGLILSHSIILPSWYLETSWRCWVPLLLSTTYCFFFWSLWSFIINSLASSVFVKKFFECNVEDQILDLRSQHFSLIGEYNSEF